MGGGGGAIGACEETAAVGGAAPPDLPAASAAHSASNGSPLEQKNASAEPSEWARECWPMVGARRLGGLAFTNDPNHWSGLGRPLSQKLQTIST